MKYVARLLIIVSLSFIILPQAWADLDDGLVAHYPFNGNADDQSGNGNNGTVYGATLTEDRFGNPDSAYNFDGLDDWIKTEPNPMFTSEPFTVAAWILPREYKMAGILETRSEEICDYYSWSFKWRIETERLYFRIYENVGIGQSLVFPLIPLNQWSFLTVTYDGNDAVAYLNGSLVDSWSDGPGILPYVTSLKIGRSENPVCGTAHEYFNGIIDDARIYNRVLSETEIQELYQEAPPQKQIEQLVKTVISLNLNQGISNSLDAKLESALQALDDTNENNDGAAINSLNAFINAVEAQRGNKIPEEDAEALIAAAQTIIAALESP